MVVQQRSQALARARGPGGNDGPALPGVNAPNVRHNCVENIGVGIGALSRERAPLPAFHGIDAGNAGFLERRQAIAVTAGQRAVPGLAVEIHTLRRHRLIRRCAKSLAFQALDAGFVMLLNLAEALLDSFIRHMVETDSRTANVIE